ncbi:MAG: Lrp/AsnC family transcriptional regulator [Desulfuromonadales bacterium]|nr:Lrp/AsnC family transcriptional regulator [Desulfuromonadales bacterium]
MDKIDRAILAALQKDGRISNVQLAEQVGLSESACLRRVRILEEEGIIDRYVTLISQAAVGKPNNVFVRLTPWMANSVKSSPISKPPSRTSRKSWNAT